ncbi:CYTH and CHAD domain-containing protein [Micromonospora sp. NBC_01813]|uniref:CYTH and CHAD domain-containing protein n=1 Tax=Micromonospora sp. NBC_01813 TaxID=2975988 RepID=UPI002DDAACEC|nr:CYTH and CHAD domain-containing protein [Micromonospora sp. NBC_01813]WSA11837.1 CYTH and CHAD domain-containing protein [Micromonospora sp. NBC_01813]
MVEEERKYEVDGGFAVPDLAGCVPDGGRLVAVPAAKLTATYYDTPDLRLARAGVSLRHRVGDEEPWTVKLPADAPGVRHEISRPGKRSKLPAELAWLVTAYSRGAQLAPAATVRTVRQVLEVRDADDALLVELADDAVSVLDGKTVRSTFREIEVEFKTGDRELLDRVETELVAAGATAGGFTPKHVRALGAAAAGPADLAAVEPLPAEPTAADVVTRAIRDGIARILAHDPLVRLHAPVGDDDTAVHQMRVGCRRLRSDLRTFRALVDSDWAAPLREEVKWLAGVLGGARDAEVLRARLRRTAAADPLAPLPSAAVDRFDAALADRHDAALAEVDAALRSDRYVALVEMLVRAAREPQLTGAAAGPATEVLPRLVAKPWRRLAYGGSGVDGAADLTLDAPDERWHEVRINGKRARYAVDAVAPVVGGGAAKLAKALSKVQNLLGEHQDAAIAADTWREIAAGHSDDHELAVTAGRLVERERTAIRAARADFAAAWDRATTTQRTKWLP